MRLFGGRPLYSIPIEHVVQRKKQGRNIERTNPVPDLIAKVDLLIFRPAHLECP